ncbi:MAG TPA: hypothetical protein VGD43_09280, partial [Micromonospora sp.]
MKALYGLLVAVVAGSTLPATPAGLALPAYAAGARTDRVSVTGGGTQADARSMEPALSADGRWLAFTSDGGNLVAGDTNGAADVFLRDLRTGHTE